MKTNTFLFAILILAAVLRLYQLGTVPLGVFGDEIDAGYNAYSLFKTGKDYNGNLLPIHSESMGDHRPIGFFLSLIPSIAVFGLSNFSVRLMPALYGILSVWLIYLLVNNLCKSVAMPRSFRHNSLGLLVALLLAITPWHIHFSRVALDVGLTVTLLLLGTYIFSIAIKSKSRKQLFWLLLTVVVFGFNSYSYQVAKLYSPLLFGINIFVFRNGLMKTSKKYLLIAIAVFLLILSPLLYDTLYGTGQSRFNSISIFSAPTTVEEINHARGQIVNSPEIVKKALHNKAITISYLFANNYLASFSPNFLFVSGDINNPRHSVPGFGLFYLWMLPFFFLGLLKVGNSLLNKKDDLKQFNLLISLWLITAPIPSALTLNGGQHAIRLFVMMPPIIILVALGLKESFLLLNELKLRYFAITLTCLIILVSSAYFIQRYLTHYSYNHHQQWQYGLEPAVKYIKEHGQEYSQIFITKSFVHLPMLYYLFYTQYDPSKLHEQFRMAKADTLPPPTDQINNIRFTTINPGDIFAPPNTLYVASPNDRQIGWEKIKTIDSPDQTDDKPVLVIQKTLPQAKP